MSEKITRPDITVEIDKKKRTITFPEIETERALAFGQNLLMLRMFNAAQKQVDNEIKMILGAISGLYEVVADINKTFADFWRGETITVEDFRAKFDEGFEMPSLEGICRAYENVKWLQIKQAEFAEKANECNRAAADLDFGIAFGETFRQLFDRLIRDVSEPEVRETVLFPNARNYNCGDWVKSRFDGRIGRVAEYKKEMNDLSVVFRCKNWDDFTDDENDRELISAENVEPVEDLREIFPKMTAQAWSFEREKAVKAVVGNHNVLNPAETVERGDLLWHIGDQKLKFADFEIGNFAGQYVLVVRPIATKKINRKAEIYDVSFFNKQVLKAIDATPQRHHVLSDNEIVCFDDLIWNVSDQEYLVADEATEVGAFASEFVQVIRPTKDNNQHIKDFVELHNQTADSPPPVGADVDEWIKERAIARGRIESDFVELEPADIIDADCFVWNIGAGMFLSPDNELLGDRAENYVLVIRPAESKESKSNLGLALVAELQKAFDLIPEDFDQRKDAPNVEVFERIQAGDQIYYIRDGVGAFYPAIPAEIGRSVKEFICVIMPTSKPKDDIRPNWIEPRLPHDCSFKPDHESTVQMGDLILEKNATEWRRATLEDIGKVVGAFNIHRLARDTPF